MFRQEPKKTYMTGPAFRQWRERHGLDQTQAGAAVDVSRRSVIAWERGDTPVSKAVWLATRYLDEHPDALAGDGTGTERPARQEYCHNTASL